MIRQARKLLGKQVRVTLARSGVKAPIVEAQLLAFGDDGEFEILADDGSVHYCWPMLDVEERRPV